MKEISTLPLFATPITVYEMEFVDQENINKILYNLKYNVIDKKPNHSSISNTLNILREYEKLKGLKIKIDQAINNYSEIIIGNSECKFELTTSWATQSKPGQSSEEHRHSNNMFSAVYYNETINDGGVIRFYLCHSPSSFELKPKKYTVFNSNYWDLPIKEKTLIVFPSYLKHAIMKNNSSQTRYSIACNYHPIGQYGQGDSELFHLGFKSVR
jgi:uncharacterized protein (TIGR02466 family)